MLVSQEAIIYEASSLEVLATPKSPWLMIFSRSRPVMSSHSAKILKWYPLRHDQKPSGQHSSWADIGDDHSPLMGQYIYINLCFLCHNPFFSLSADSNDHEFLAHSNDQLKHAAGRLLHHRYVLTPGVQQWARPREEQIIKHIRKCWRTLWKWWQTNGM